MRITMFATLGLLCLLGMSTTNAMTPFKFMDSGEQMMSGKACPAICPMLVDWGLKGISYIFSTFLKDLRFTSGTCDCVVSDLGNFNFTEECTSNEAGDIFDHKFTIFFDDPQGTCTCPLPNDPAAAAKTIMGGLSPTGTCGKDKVKDTMPEPTIKCDGDADAVGNDSPIEMAVNVSKGVLDLVMRVDVAANEAYPLHIIFNLIDDPLSLKVGPEFEKAFECINSEENRPELLRKIFYNSFAVLFECLDDKKAFINFAVSRLLYSAGNCQSTASLG